MRNIFPDIFQRLDVILQAKILVIIIEMLLKQESSFHKNPLLV